jgi:serine/threonine protein kinase
MECTDGIFRSESWTSPEECLESLTLTEQDSKEKIVERSPKGRFFRVIVKQFNEVLGSGAYKTVYRGYDNELGREVAWNIINLRNVPPEDRGKFSQEVKITKRLQHPNIIRFIAAWNKVATDELVMITELVTGGTLKHYLKKIGRPRLKVIKLWCSGILRGLDYLHSQKPQPIVHRDLKPENIFIMANTGDIRIGDFGLSTFMFNSVTKTLIGTAEYMAPELYEGHYGTPVDIYAFGMCVLEMCTTEAPYSECQSPAAIYRKVISGIVPKALDRLDCPEIRAFIAICLGEERKRPKACELLNHPFLQIREEDPAEHAPVQIAMDCLVLRAESTLSVASNGDKQVELSLIIGDCCSKPKEIKFMYDIEKDKPEEVAEEMVEQLNLEKAAALPIAKEIEVKLAMSLESAFLEESPLNSLSENSSHSHRPQRVLVSNCKRCSCSQRIYQPDLFEPIPFSGSTPCSPSCYDIFHTGPTENAVSPVYLGINPSPYSYKGKINSMKSIRSESDIQQMQYNLI